MKRFTIFLVFLSLVSLCCSLLENSVSAPVNKTAVMTIAATTEKLPSPTGTSAVKNTCMVVVGALHLRESPSSKARVLEYLHDGSVLELMKTQPGNTWLSVKTITGKTGFVNSIFTNCRRNK